MKQQRFLRKFCDWLFNLLIDHLKNSGWVIVIKDFKRSEKIKERKYLGLTDYKNQIIYLDKDKERGRELPKTFVHELCHFALGIVFEKMAGNLPWKEIKKVKGKRRADKEFEWEEQRTLEFEKLFYSSLTKMQIKVLWGFIDEARARYKEEGN